MLNSDLEICKLLFKKGADPDLKTRYGELPIDLAVKFDLADVVMLLDAGKTKGGNADKMVDGVPTGVLEQIFRAYGVDEEYFISWNGKDASGEQAKFLEKLIGPARAVSRMETLEERPLGAHTWYRDKKDGKFGRLLQLTLKHDGEKWSVRLRDSAGPSMAGGGWAGDVRKKYGHWSLERTSSWAE